MPKPTDLKPKPRLISEAIDGPTADRLFISIIHGRLYRCQPEWTIPEMKIGYDGLFFIHQGVGWVNINGEHHNVSPGMLLLMRQADTLAAGHDPKRPIRTYSIGFTLRTGDGDDLLQQRNWPLILCLSKPQAKTWAGMMKLLTEDIQSRSSAGQTLAHGRLLLALDHVDRLVGKAGERQKVFRSEPARQPDPRIKELLKFIDNNLAAPLSTSLLAKKAHVSATHLAYLFRGENLPAPMDLVRQRRIARARTLLATEDLKIAAVAKAVGYADPFHFSRVFSRLQGCPPESYRASCKHPFDS